MNKLIALIPFSFVLCTLYLFFCDTTEPPPKEEKPPGYQEDIPWPSLVDSPWPMHHGNPQSNGRSRFNGPQNGTFEKVFNSPELFGLVIGPDSMIYCSSNDFAKGGLYAYSSNGELKWHVPSLTSQTPALVSSDGTIYFSSISTLYAVNLDGSVKWEYNYENNARMFIRGINIGLDNKIYFITSNSELCAVDEDGNLVWKMQDSRIRWGNNTIVFSPDGGTIYCVGQNNPLVAIDVAESQVKWSFGKFADTFNRAPPIVDSQDNIYINAIVDSINSGLATVFSLYPNGNMRWVLETGEIICRYQPTMDREGNIYFANDTLYAIDYLGELNWILPLGGHLGNNLVCDASDVIYVCIYNPELLLYAVDKKGSIKWQLNYPVYDVISPYAIGYGELYIPASNWVNFYLIK